MKVGEWEPRAQVVSYMPLIAEGMQRTLPHCYCVPGLQGMLSIGAAMLGSPSVLGVDIDEDALCLASENLEDADCSELVQTPDSLSIK